MAEPQINIPFTETPQVLPQADLDPKINFMANDIRVKNSILPSQRHQMDSFQGVYNIGKDNRIQTKAFDVKVSDAFTPLSTGEFIPKFESYIPGINNEERLANMQDTSEKWANGVGKFLGKTVTAILGGTIGTVDSLITGITQGSLSAAYNSGFNTWLDDLNKKMDYNLPNYYTEQEKQKGFFSSMGTANFWANDVLGGLSFTVGTVVSEGIWAYATGGTSLLARGVASTVGRLGLKQAALNTAKAQGKAIINKSGREGLEGVITSAPNAKRIADFLNTGRFLMTSAGYESGMEARHYMREAEESWVNQYQQTTGRRPSDQELANFKRELTTSGNGVFVSNLAIVGASNLAVFGRLALGKPVKSTIENNPLKKFFFGVGYNRTADGAYKTVSANSFQKTFGRLYGIGRPAVIEGAFEEGGQAVTANTAENYMLNAFDPEGTKVNYDMISAFTDAFQKTYGTKEGFKEVGIGMIIGLLGGGVTSLSTGQGLFNEVGAERANVESFVNYRNQFTNQLSAKMLEERLIANNRIQKATENREKAQANNDLTGEIISDQEVMIASIERDFSFQGIEQGIEDFQAGLATIDNSELAKELGIDESSVEDWKELKLTEYADMAQDYSRNRRYAEALLGNYDAKEFRGKKTEIEKGIAFNITMGKRASELSSTYLSEIKSEIAQEIIGSEATDALDVQHALQKVSKDKLNQYNKLKNKHAALEERLRVLSSRTVAAQYENAATEDNQQRTNQLNSLTKQTIDVQQELERVNQDKQIAFRALNLENISELDITEDMLNNQASNVTALQNTINSVREADPQRYATLTNLFKEYDKSISYANSFANTTKRLTDPKTSLTEINGLVSKLMSRFSNENQTTAEFFAQQAEGYLKRQEQLQTEFERVAVDRNNAEVRTQQEDGITPPTQTGIINKKSTEEIDFAFEQNIELSKIGTKQQYSQYLNTVFPSSKVKDILYHGSESKERFEVPRTKEGFFLTPEKIYAWAYGNKGHILQAIVDVRNPSNPSEPIMKHSMVLQEGTDAIIGKEKGTIDRQSVVIFNPEQIHILGSKKDIEGFKNFINVANSSLNSNQSRYETTQDTETQSAIENIKSKINSILKGGSYTAYYYGDDPTELMKQEPSNKDVERYEELLSISGFNNGEVIPDFSEELPLTQEQYNEFLELNQKLNDWKTLQGASFEDNDSVAGLLQLLNEKQQEFSRQNTKTDITRQDFIEIQKAPEAEIRKTGESLSTIINPDNAVVSLDTSGNSYQLSNVDINTIQNLIPDSTLYKLVDGIEKIDEGTNWKNKGNKYVIRFRDEKLLVEVGDRSRLLIKKEDLDKALPNTNIRILDFGSSKYLSLYERLPNGDLKPVRGDFSYKSVLNNENISFSPEAVYDLKEGDILRTEINKNDSYNNELLQQYNKDKNKENLINNVNIFVTKQGATSEILGSMRALESGTKYDKNETISNLYNFRKEAVEKMLKSKSSKVDLGRTIEVRFTLVGNPNIEAIEQGDTVVPKNINITQEALDQIEDIGYIENGEINTQKNLQLKNNETIFVRNINSQDKVPLVVFRYRGMRQAFPVSLIKTEVDRSQQVIDAINSNLSTSQKIIKIERALKNNNLNPSDYDLDPTTDWLNSEGLEFAIRDLRIVEDFVDVETWVNPSFNFRNIANQATIAIDITDRPFAAGKTVLNLSEVGFSSDTDILVREREDKEAEQIELEKSISNIAKNIYSDWLTNPAYENIQEGGFVEVFDNNEILRDTTNHLQEVHNVNVLRQALNTRIPSVVQENLSENINTARNLLRELEVLDNQVRKIKVSIKDNNLQSEVENQKICN